ncbi:MAG TPA: diacylglycerol kinase family protein [Candidatus Acidoferrales bacterium]|nr:diacylglycerol kinase family protein [Candidatus Acidoferrales bacterium]
MSERFLAIVNPAAGGRRCGKLARAALDDLRRQGVEIEVKATSAQGDATQIARECYRQGMRNFIAVGGDGTSYEIVNGLFPEALAGERPAIGFLPLGTGNSFLKDFTSNGASAAASAIVSGTRHRCDVMRLSHAAGEIYYINLLTLGFPADVATTTNRNFKGLGEAGYILGVLVRLAQLKRRAFPHRLDSASGVDRRRCLFLSFNNSRFTGGKMMIAPKAAADDGLLEYVRWGPIGRLGLLKNFPTLFDGTHINHPLASRAAVREVEFLLDGPVNVMIDGEDLELDLRKIEVLPGALDVFA